LYQEEAVVSESLAQTVERMVVESQDDSSECLARQIVTAFDSLAKSGLLGASTGDVSLRLPGSDGMLVTPLVPFVEGLSASDVIKIAGGRMVHRRGRPSFSMQMHLEVYRRRPDVNAIVHCHAPVATVLGICELPIPPVTFDAVPFVDLPRVPASVTEDSHWPQEVAARLAGGAPAALLLNNGIVTVGNDIHQAVRRTLALEETARILVVCYLLQQVPVTLPASAVEILRNELL
jgi:L-fuculose-phosphate aldolase